MDTKNTFGSFDHYLYQNNQKPKSQEYYESSVQKLIRVMGTTKSNVHSTIEK